MPILSQIKDVFLRFGIRLPKWLIRIFSKPTNTESYIPYERFVDLPPTRTLQLQIECPTLPPWERIGQANPPDRVLKTIQIECPTLPPWESVGQINHGFITIDYE